MAFNDLREWLTQVDGMGELRCVSEASRDEDIGRITEMLPHTDEAPAALFHDTEGSPRGYRILVNAHGARRRLALTLGLPVDISGPDLMQRFTEMVEHNKPLPMEWV